MKPAEEIEMAYRLVTRSPQVRTAEEAEAFVVIDTGSAVFPVAGKTTEVPGGFRVEVQSLDGHRSELGGVPVAASIVKGRSLFRVIAVDAEKGTALLEDQSRFRIETPRTVDQFCGDVIELQEGQTISAVVTGEYERIGDVLVEGDLHERADLEGPQPELRGWAPYNNPQKPAGK
jgi:hypothetical protein